MKTTKSNDEFFSVDESGLSQARFGSKEKAPLRRGFFLGRDGRTQHRVPLSPVSQLEPFPPSRTRTIVAPTVRSSRRRQVS
jgi:hypothetical protein